jgi:predicted Fe-Mo cluster-binding NifX family protein
MKYLIASSGNTLGSFVVKRFEHAAWYLIVDDQKSTLEAKQHLSPHDRHAMLAKAIGEHVRTVVAGKFGEHAIKTMIEHDLDAAIIHGITVREALQKIKVYDILLVSAEELYTEREIASERAESLPTHFTRVDTSGRTSEAVHVPHHLQQYGGRGH